VETVAKAIEELHDRIQNDLMGGLKLGMYLDLDSLNDGEQILTNGDNQRLRIVIADFNQYKGKMGNDNTTNHIKFVFKNIPVEKKMRNDSRNMGRNAGGYPYDGTGTYAGNGTPELRPYLETQFLPGLKTALGIDVDDDTYFYTVKRDIIIGDNGPLSGPTNWNVGTLEAAIFIDTLMEAKGSWLQEKENVHTQTALYQVNSTWAVKNGTDNGLWWTATPDKGNATQFYCYSGYESANQPSGVVPAFCIK
jgi:hypothetical protein